MCWAMFKNFCGGGGSSPKNPAPPPIRTKKPPPPPLGEKSSKEEPPNDEKVAIAPPHGRRQRGARVGGRPPPTGKLKKRLLAIWGAFLLLFLHVEAFSATFMRGGGFSTCKWGPFLTSLPPMKISAGAQGPSP